MSEHRTIEQLVANMREIVRFSKSDGDPTAWPPHDWRELMLKAAKELETFAKHRCPKPIWKGPHG